MTDDLTWASTYIAPNAITRVHYARCEPCIYGQHHPTPTWHSWADEDDVAHALATGQPDPSNKRCACPCVEDAAFCHRENMPEPEVVEVVSLDAEPCAYCGEAGACAYDDSGRPLIHAVADEDAAFLLAEEAP